MERRIEDDGMSAEGASTDGAAISEVAEVVSLIGPASRLEEEGNSREEDLQVAGGVGSSRNKSTKVLMKKGT